MTALLWIVGAIVALPLLVMIAWPPGDHMAAEVKRRIEAAPMAARWPLPVHKVVP